MATADEVLVRPPQHPVPTLQGPFEESMIESVSDLADNDVPADAVTRRAMLLELPRYERVISGRWRQKAGEKYHPLWKLFAQMAFGIHLLAQNLAKSDEEVMKILQGHVDDVDGFLERTTDDFEVAQEDIYERLRCLQLPLEHSDVFDRMLEDRVFRASILDGNEQIEHIISRTTKAMRDSMKDVQKGFDATNVLDGYLNSLSLAWQRQTAEHEAVFHAMLGNTEGWRKALMEMHLQGNKLAGTLNGLSSTVAEMQHRAAVISRRQLAQSQASGMGLSQISLATYSERSTSRTSQNHKPLPAAPGEQQFGSRGPSRATQTFSLSSRPDSAQRSSRANSTDSRSILNASPDSFASRRNFGSPVPPSDLDSRTMSPQPPQQTQNYLPAQSQLHHQHTANKPIELPADVPEEILRQAPVSRNSRMSAALGLRAEDITERRKSGTYYPRALSGLLKPQLSPTVLASLSSGQRMSTLQPISPQAGPGNDYFAGHEQNLSISMATLASRKGQDSTKSSREGSGTVASVPSSKIHDSRNTPSPRLAFTSHTDVMEMASPPSNPQRMVGGLDTEAPDNQRGLESRSSLGEPGPELTEAENETATPLAPLSIGPDDLLGSTDVRLGRSSRRTVPQSTVDTGTSIQIPKQTEPPLAEEESSDWKEVVPTSVKSTRTGALEQTDTDKAQENKLEQHHDNVESKFVSTPAAQPLAVAELEADVPVDETDSTPESPIELEAIEKQLTLSSDSRDFVTPAEVLAASVLSIKQRAEYFQTIATHQHEPALKPEDFKVKVGGEREPIKPLNLKLTRLDGHLIPVQAMTNRDEEMSEEQKAPLTPVESTVITSDVLASMIDQISNTPTGSPAHARNSSSTSSNSAQISTSTMGRPYAPPEAAPPPPAPGGRSMVNPNYANAALFDGERKQPKHGGSSSKSGWDILGGGSRPRASTDLRGISLRPGSRRNTSSELLTAAGKDVLWYKDTKNAVSVSSG